jgi:hypothetical protein
MEISRVDLGPRRPNPVSNSLWQQVLQTWLASGKENCMSKYIGNTVGLIRLEMVVNPWNHMLVHPF